MFFYWWKFPTQPWRRIKRTNFPPTDVLGIPEVWIVNLIDETIEIYREPHLAGYASKTILRSGDKATPQAFADVEVDVTGLLKK